MPEQERPLEIRITGENEGAKGEIEQQRDHQENQDDRVGGGLGEIGDKLAFQYGPNVFHGEKNGFGFMPQCGPNRGW
jgi:hypothetical protein